MSNPQCPYPRMLSRVAWIAAIVIALAHVTTAQTIHCDALRVSENSYAGRCSKDSTTVALLVLRPPKSPTKGRWQGTTLARIFGEKGDHTKDKVDWDTFQPVSVDVGVEDGLFSWCWCAVTHATFDTEGIHFEADPRREAGATSQDIQVLKRARGYFTNSTSWNRHDDRNRAISYCPHKPSSRTLFCALYDASVTVRGEFYLLTPVNDAVWKAIDAASPRQYRHPLTDFNNDPLVDFATMTRMLDNAVRRMQETVAKQRRGA